MHLYPTFQFGGVKLNEYTSSERSSTLLAHQVEGKNIVYVIFYEIYIIAHVRHMAYRTEDSVRRGARHVRRTGSGVSHSAGGAS
jgi:hypothetical protein